MGEMISLDIEFNSKMFGDRITSLIDAKTMQQIHQLLKTMCNEYVPAGDTLFLADGAQAFAEYLYYPGPYAHYMYEGLVYGPNFQVWDKDTGEYIGWRSYKGKTKYPNGNTFDYSHEKHSRATSHWDKVMFSEQKDKFLAGVKDILIRRAKELYG